MIDIPNEEVPKPVGSSGESHTLGTVFGGEELGNDGPDDGTPGRSVEKNEERGDDNHALAGSGGVLRVLNVEHKVSDGGEDHKADEHQGSTSNEGLAATKVLNNVETTKGGSKVDSSENDLSDERVGDTGTLEDGGTIVEEVVGASELLQSLEDNTQKNTVQHAWGGDKFVPFLGLLLFSVELRLDFSQLADDDDVVLWDTVETGHSRTGSVNLAVAVVEARAFRKHGHAETKDECEQEGQT